jgi:putative restriction endonuclease
MPVNLDIIHLGVRYDRPTLARLWGYQSHAALSRGVVTPKHSPYILLFVTRIKQSTFTQYNDYISGDQLYWEGETGHLNDERIASASQHGDTIHLFYREIHHSLFEYKGTIEIVKCDLEAEKPSRFVFRLVNDLGPTHDLEAHFLEFETISATERAALAKARVGQGLFRKRLLDIWRGCAVTGVFFPEILRASHIKPWRFSNNAERLSPYNGLLLLPQYDSLFDAGLISFADSGAILRSKVLEKTTLPVLGINHLASLRKIDVRHKPYLEYHRQHIFSW